ncbi:E3 ubiquitin-protein ligase RSL1-like [Phragmites australis]|uniref:E3 ubiquitin-protein ligase RSL1-like n=1 Tax=Phragmites australis TaxID=29695 RepID=UPI002D79E1EE|nr:E3 ubiquitin-protein ligase RSL1-like [Phragmites australis]
MAAGSSNAGLVDDFYFAALAHGRNDADASGDDELFPISDEKYAAELQLQEVIMSSALAATASSSVAPRLSSTAATSNNAAASFVSAALVKGECSSAASSSQPSLAATFVFCKICMEAVPPSDAHRASRGCAHAFCGGCLERYIGAKIQDRIAEVSCPEERCGGVLDPELCQGMLPREVFERWGAALCEFMVLGAKRAYCPYEDCSAMMLVDDDGDVRDVAESECLSCRRLFCARCVVAPWHAGVTCDEYDRFGKVDSCREDMMLLEMAKGKKWKRCPRCDFFVEKDQGCLHITCRCGFEFCYGCGQKWGVTHSSCSTA